MICRILFINFEAFPDKITNKIKVTYERRDGHLIPPLGSVRKIEKVSEIDEKRAEEHYHDYIIC